MSTQINQQEIVFDESVIVALEQLRKLKAQIAVFQEQADILTEQIKYSMGDATVGTIDGRPAVRWTTHEVNRFDTKKAQEVLPAELVQALTVKGTQKRFVILEQD